MFSSVLHADTSEIPRSKHASLCSPLPCFCWLPAWAGWKEWISNGEITGILTGQWREILRVGSFPASLKFQWQKTVGFNFFSPGFSRILVSQRHSENTCPVYNIALHILIPFLTLDNFYKERWEAEYFLCRMEICFIAIYLYRVWFHSDKTWFIQWYSL